MAKAALEQQPINIVDGAHPATILVEIFEILSTIRLSTNHHMPKPPPSKAFRIFEPCSQPCVRNQRIEGAGQYKSPKPDSIINQRNAS